MTETVALLPAPPAGVEWSPRGLRVVDPSLPFEQWESILVAAGEIKTAMSFVIGDLLNYGEARYGERYSQAMDATGLAYSTLSNYAYVMRMVVFSRRRMKLRFGHHEAVASLEPAEQDEWLVKAEESGWTRDQLRDAIQDAQRLAGVEPRRKPPAARQEVLDGPGVVDASRNLSTVREALVAANGHLEDGDGAADLAERLPRAMRALDEAGQTIQRAALALERPSLTEAARHVVKNATLSGGFYMVETEVFQAFAALVAADE